MLAIALISALGVAPVVLAWKPAAEPTLTYDWERSGLYGAIEPDDKMTLTQQVLDASKPDSIHLKETLVLVQERVGFQAQPVDKNHPYTESWQLTRNGHGYLLGYDSPKEPHWPDEVMMSAPLIDIIYPGAAVRIGEQWSYHEEDATSNRVTDFTYLGVEKFGHWKCNKVKLALHVTTNNGEGRGKLSGSGTYWLDVADGAIVKSDLKINEHETAAIKLHEVITRRA